MQTLEVASGLVRDDAFQIDIVFPSSQPLTIELRAERNGMPLGTAGSFSWPNDFEIVGQEGAKITGRLNLPVDRSLMPITGLAVNCARARVKYGREYFLNRLFPGSTQEFEEIFFREKARIRDKETLRFSSEQIFDFYGGPESHRIIVAVIFIYKSIEMDRKAELSEFMNRISTAEQIAGKIPVGNHPRNDRYLLTVSLLTAAWHAFLFLRRQDDFVGTLARAIEYIKSIPLDQAKIAYLNYNASKTILTYATIMHESGNIEECKSLHAYNFTLYKDLFSMVKISSYVLFNEMTETHRIVANSLASLAAIGRGKHDFVKAEAIYDLVGRVAQPPEIKVEMVASLDGVLASLRAANSLPGKRFGLGKA